MSVLVHGARKLDADGIVDDFWLLTAGPTIVATGTGDSWRAPGVVPPDADVLDAGGAWLTPGLIDLHAHGGGGFSFDDGADAIRSALAVHRAHGTTRSVISLVANPPHVLTASLDAIARIAADDPLVLGSHLEGPFLAPSRKGAHDVDFLGVPTHHVLKQLLEASEGRLVQITIAPELPGALEAIDTFVSAGTVVAIGHTDAGYDLTREAFDRGATLLTHAFNAMPGIHHRDPGPVTAALDDPRITLELIADGVHVHPAVLALAFAAAPWRIALVTDAMAAAGAPDGAYHLGTLPVTVRDGVATLTPTDAPAAAATDPASTPHAAAAATGTSAEGAGRASVAPTIAGSTLTQDAALRTALAAGVDPVAAVTALTATPARVLGRPDLGRLTAGHAADLVLLTPTFEVTHVWAAGRPLP
ncbi:amidohydrolase family protein [Herbiconiux sp. VKM Ac-1786]|uniref:N-acetylglucosamine-6-phosphate deacetylase n=1 Tax=Herbiconiux sp. VKM Ac-1786 TaxID=2783824 RepID=UPI00188A9BB7|nr:amidohydrolase family protein [Herbiconiux sp. VKM Ac-1786]MBF4571351.1 amidohydrolase family protein [Herbiconiux sp. VKM Ac-1786]